MQINMLDAKNQLSRLVKNVLAGEDVVTVGNGKPTVRPVPVAKQGHLTGWGKLKKFRGGVDEAFTPKLDKQIAKSLEGKL